MIRLDVFTHSLAGCLCGHNVHYGKSIVKATTVERRVVCDHCVRASAGLPTGRTLTFVSPKTGVGLAKGTQVAYGKGNARVFSVKEMRQFRGKKTPIKAYAVVLEYMPA